MALGVRMCIALIAALALLTALTFSANPNSPSMSQLADPIIRPLATLASSRAGQLALAALTVAIDLTIRGIWALV